MIHDVTAADFQAKVLDATGYVVVDFWAPWCAPCRQLKPLLEKLAPEFGYTLAKVNTEEEQELPARFGVRGIPDVRIFKDGKEVERFTGALPESNLREKFGKLMGSRLDAAMEEIDLLALEGNLDGAVAKLNGLLAENPSSGALKLKAARLSMTMGNPEDAKKILSAFTQGEPEYREAQAILALADLEEACRERKEESDEDRLYAAASCFAVAGEFEKALELFLKLVEVNREYRDDGARKAMVAIFGVLGNDPLVRAFRGRLSSVLN